MKIRVASIVVLLGVALTGAFTSGCASRAHADKAGLRFGVVNLERILPEIDDYKKFSEQYVQERQRLIGELGTDPKKVEAFLKDDQRKQELEQSIQKWDQTRRKFVDKLTEEIRTASTAVAKEKNLDIVLIDTPWLHLYQRLGYDITIEVQAELKDGKKAR